MSREMKIMDASGRVKTIMVKAPIKEVNPVKAMFVATVSLAALGMAVIVAVAGMI